MAVVTLRKMLEFLIPAESGKQEKNSK